MIYNIPGIEIEYCRGISKGCKNSVMLDNDFLNKVFEIASGSNWSKKFVGKDVLRHNLIKIGISGCPNACAKSQIKDLGLIARSEVFYVQDLCSLCMQCVDNCEEQAISYDNEKIKIDKRKCIGCGRCIKVCETGAIYEKGKFFSVLVGGRLGRHPRFGEEIFRMSPSKTISFVSFFLSLFDKVDITQPKKLFDVISPLEIKVEYSKL